jgi:hypothetical protein
MRFELFRGKRSGVLPWYSRVSSDAAEGTKSALRYSLRARPAQSNAHPRLAEVAGTTTRQPYPGLFEFDWFMIPVFPKSKNPLVFSEWVRNLLLLVSYAAGSPDCRMDVVVPVLVVKHMAMAKLVWRTFMMGDYSPEREQSQGQRRGVSSLKVAKVTSNARYQKPDAHPQNKNESIAFQDSSETS